jgi:predicted ATPase
MADSADYLLTVGAYAGHAEPPTLPGRGYVYHTPPLPCQICLPAPRLALDDDVMRQETQTLMAEMSQAYRSGAGKAQAPEPIGELPVRIVLETLPSPEPRARIVTPLGISDDDSLSLFQLDWWEQGPHFIVSGSPGSGKTNLLQVAVLQAARQHSPQAVRFVLVDFTGRSLRQLARLKHTLAHVTDQEMLADVLAQLRAEMQLFRQQEQQHGERVNLPRTVLVIDDYDLFSDSLSAAPDIMRELRDHVRLNSVLGLHVWAAGYFERVSDPLARQILMQRCGFALGSRESLYPFNLRTAGLPADALPAGRAYFAQYNRLQILQCALVDDALYYVYGCNQSADAPAEWYASAVERQPTVQQDDPRISDLTIDTAGLIADLLGDEEPDDA